MVADRLPSPKEAQKAWLSVLCPHLLQITPENPNYAKRMQIWASIEECDNSD